ncbi:hypothetical protein D3C87_1904300 [compost metagenome]
MIKYRLIGYTDIRYGTIAVFAGRDIFGKQLYIGQGNKRSAAICFLFSFVVHVQTLGCTEPYIPFSILERCSFIAFCTGKPFGLSIAFELIGSCL